MEPRERNVINAALASTESSVSERHGFVDAFLTRVRIWISTGRYTRQVRRIVEERNSTIAFGLKCGS